jgi:LPXTG-motif cell wall-anchored protein
MLFETDTTTNQVLTMYGIWFAFIAALLVILFKGKNRS